MLSRYFGACNYQDNGTKVWWQSEIINYSTWTLNFCQSRNCKKKRWINKIECLTLNNFWRNVMFIIYYYKFVMPGVQGKLNSCSFGGDFTSNFEQQLRRKNMWNKNCIVAIIIYLFMCVSMLHNLSKTTAKCQTNHVHKKYSKNTLTVHETILKVVTKNVPTWIFVFNNNIRNNTNM